MAVIILAKKIVKGAVDLQTFSIRATWYPGQAGMEEAEREARGHHSQSSFLAERTDISEGLSRYNTVSHSIGLVLNCFSAVDYETFEHHQLAPEDVWGTGQAGVTASVPKILGDKRRVWFVLCSTTLRTFMALTFPTYPTYLT